MIIPDPRRHAFRPDLADARLRGQVEAARFVEGALHQVVVASAVLRREPRDESAIDTEALHGQDVLVFEVRADGWSWVQLLPDRYVGYLPSAALTSARIAPTHRVAVLRTFVYPEANIKTTPDMALSIGSRVTAQAHDQRFARLARSGYVIAAHLAPIDQHEKDFVAVAEKFLGTPYRWGGKTSHGCDCSGLVQLALDATGVEAPRDSDMQEAELGTPLNRAPDFSGLKRGDLVFWPGHVGVMRDEKTLLHANGHHMLVVSEKLDEAVQRIAEKSGPAITAIKRL
jgi:cell wall-associated NlpC family hydrolase